MTGCHPTNKREAVESESLAALVKGLPRPLCEIILTEHGFQVYDKEDAATLRYAIEVNVGDGTFLKNEVELAIEAWERAR